VELGVFQLNGPVVAEYVCKIGEQCDLKLTGYGLESTNELVIVYGPYDQINQNRASGAGCGDTYFDPVNQVGVMPASLSYGATTFNMTDAFFQIGQAFGPVGNYYSLCWAPVPSTNIPAALPQFKVTVDRTFVLAYPVDDSDKWSSQTGGGGGYGDFLAPKSREEQYHDDQSNLDLAFKPPGRM
jgi:hypothetical protein